MGFGSLAIGILKVQRAFLISCLVVRFGAGASSEGFRLGTQKGRKHKRFIGISLLIGLHYKGFYMGFPVLMFAYVLLGGPY